MVGSADGAGSALVGAGTRTGEPTGACEGVPTVVGTGAGDGEGDGDGDSVSSGGTVNPFLLDFFFPDLEPPLLLIPFGPAFDFALPLVFFDWVPVGNRVLNKVGDAMTGASG